MNALDRAKTPPLRFSRVEPADLLDATLLVVLCVAVYSFGITREYFWDDEHLLAAAARLRSPLDAFSVHSLGLSDFDGRVSFWRPLATLSFALDLRLFGPSAWSHRAVNVALHAANAVFALGFLRRRLVEMPPPWARFGALAIAAFWAMAPARAEAVSWISARPDLLGTFFVLGGATLYARTSTRATRLALLLVTAGGAVLSKEAYVLATALVFLEREEPFSERRSEVALLATLALSYVTWRSLAVGIGGGGRSLLATLPLADRAFLALETLGYAVDASVRFWTGVLFRGPIGFEEGGLSLEPPFAALGLLGLGLGLFLAIRTPRSRLWLATLALVFLPVANVLPTGIEARLCDRYLYLPSLVLYAGFRFIDGAAPIERRRWLLWALPLVALPLGALAALRAAEFGHPVLLLRGEIEGGRPPHSVYRQAGFEFVEAGLYDEARTAYLGALTRREELGLPPPLADALEAFRWELEVAPPGSEIERSFLDASACLLAQAPRTVNVELDGGSRRLEFACADPTVIFAMGPHLGVLAATRLTLAARAGHDVSAEIRKRHARCSECTREHVELAEAALALAEPSLALDVLGNDPHRRFERSREFARLQAQVLARGPIDGATRATALFLGAAYRPACLAGESAGSDEAIVRSSCRLAGVPDEAAGVDPSPDDLALLRSHPDRRRRLVEERLTK